MAAKMTEREERILTLATRIAHANHAYWVSSVPVISDAAYDALVNELKSLDPGHPILSEVGPAPSGATYKHPSPMLSLNKATTLDEVKKWWEGIGKLPVVVTPKGDGVALAAHYRSGLLQRVVTRGDGEKGQVVTDQAMLICGIPKEIPTTKVSVEIRGEAMMDRSWFNSHMKDKGYSSPRNAVAGLLHATPDATRERLEIMGHIYMTAYDVLLDNDPAVLPTMEDKFSFTRDHICDNAPICNFGMVKLDSGDTDLALRMAWVDIEARFGEKGAGLPFDSDGLVFRVNDCFEGEELGKTSHHPRHSIALKFSTDQVTTAILDIEWSVSRNNTITPVAILEPVEVEGAIIQRATLHNITIFENLALKRGDELVIERAGGVIPKVVANNGGGTEYLSLPVKCPICGHAVDYVDSESGVTTAVCMYTACPAAVAGQLEHWCKALSIDGFGPGVCTALADHGVGGILNLYRMAPDEFQSSGMVGEKVARKLWQQVWDATGVASEADLLHGLGIDNVGKSAAKKIQAHMARRLGASLVHLLTKLVQLYKAGELAKMILDIGDGLGTAVATSICAYVALPANRTRMEKLASFHDAACKIVSGDSGAHTAMSPPAHGGSDSTTKGSITSLTDKSGAVVIDAKDCVDQKGASFAFTGALDLGKRADVQAFLIEVCAVPAKGVNKDTNYLVRGPDAREGGKVFKARKMQRDGHHIRIISQSEFISILRHGA